MKEHATDFQKRTVTSLSGTRLDSRIMQLTRDSSGELIVVAETGLRWVNEQDGSFRDVTFEDRLFRHRLVSMPDGRRGVAGYSSRGGDSVAVLDLTGAELMRIEERSMATRIPMADVMGGPEIELLVPDRLKVRIFSLDGTLLTTVSSPRYMTIKTVVQADEDANYEIAFVQTSLREGPIEALIMNADGSVVSEWSDREGGWLSFVPELDDTTLWGITSEGFTAWNTQGERVSTFPAPAADYLRFVLGTKFKDHTAFIASGGGYTSRSLLCVFDDERRLVYQEVFPFRIYAVYSEAGRSAFFVGANREVLRYSVGRGGAR